jgi:p-hydroxybenzoate 3-monooxygenase
MSARNSPPQRTQVVIVGGGPAGSLLALMLERMGVESLILELRSREYVLSRVRAGVIEHGTAQVLRDIGVGARMDHEGFQHGGVNLTFGGEVLRIDFDALAGRYVVIYGQTELQKDLYRAIDEIGVPLIDEVQNVGVHGLEGTSPTVSFRRGGLDYEVASDFVVGCDGVHGITRGYVPSTAIFERIYPFVWVGLLSETPPLRHELVYANHDRGFALCSMRNENLSRYYVQGGAGDSIDDWSDERFWDELAGRLPEDMADDLVTGASVEKLVTPLRSWVSEPMSHGRLFLAGDAAHVVPPTGAKGLNLAISDVLYLSEALGEHYSRGSDTGLDGYSTRALQRVWKAVRFSWWMTTIMHRFPGMDDDFDRRLQRAELEYLFSSDTAQRSLAENYVGLPL